MDKIYKNALICEQLTRLTPKEKQKIIIRLLKNKTERQLSSDIGIPHSTIHDWKTLRQDNTGRNMHLSLSFIVRKLENLDPNEITDWGRIEQIKEIVNNLLRLKK